VSTTPEDLDAALREWLRAWAKDHPRRGFRPAYHDARAEGWNVNHKKLQRLWREEGLRVSQRRRRKRHGISTAPQVSADAPDQVWAADFQFDVTTDGRPIKIVSIVDEHTRESLGDLVERSITAEELINELERLVVDRGAHPAVLRCDNGPELACAAMADWAARRVGLHFIPPGEPWRMRGGATFFAWANRSSAASLRSGLKERTRKALSRAEHAPCRVRFSR
jgi:putative transposase